MDQVERYSIIFQLEMQTLHSRDYLESLSDDTAIQGALSTWGE